MLTLAARKKVGPATAVVIILAYVAFLIWIKFLPEAPPPTPEELKQQAAERAQWVEGEKNRENRARENVYWCSLAGVCSKYAEARDQCAVAGDFTNCLHVKMGKYWDRVGQCTDDGELIDPPAHVPNTLECVGVCCVNGGSSSAPLIVNKAPQNLGLSAISPRGSPPTSPPMRTRSGPGEVEKAILRQWK